MNVLIAEWADTVKQRTNGQLTWELHQWKELGFKGPEMLGLYGSGVTKIGEMGGSYLLGEEPILAMASLPFLGTIEQMDEKMDALRPYLTKAMADHNVQPLWLSEYANVVFSKIEINTLDDLDNLKMRTHPPVIKALDKAGHGTGITLPWGDIYQGLATGIINGVASSGVSGLSMSFHEQTDHLYLSPIVNGAPTFGVINKDALNSLPADVQKVLLDTAKEYEPKILDAMRLLTAEQKTKLQTGVTIHDSMPQDIINTLMTQGAKPVWEEWIVENPDNKPAMDAMMSALGVQ